MSGPRPLVLRPRALAALVAASSLGLVAFGWPLLAHPTAGVGHDGDAPWLFALLVPLVLAVVLAELTSGGLDAKAVALLGVLTAVTAALRPVAGEATGVQPMFVVLLLAGRVFGPGFGFALGALGMFTSALLTGGVGPWLPFQMLGAAWLGMGAGLLPPARGRREAVLLAGYGAVAGLAYGALLDLWFWPFATGYATGVAFIPGAPLAVNLHHLWLFWLTTSLGFDVPRAAANAALVLLAGGAVLRALRRAGRRASFAPGRAPGRPATTGLSGLTGTTAPTASGEDPQPGPSPQAAAAAATTTAAAGGT